MTTPRTLNDLDRMLGDACSFIAEAAGSASSIGSDGDRKFKRALANALVRVWDARDIIHSLRPDLKSELAMEAAADPDSCNAYFAACSRARKLSAEEQFDGARAILLEFVVSTESTYFRRQAENELSKLGGSI